MGRSLTIRQSHFVTEYVENRGNATQAALAAYNCNYEAAAVTGSRLLRNANIQREIRRLLNDVHLDAGDAVQVIKDALSAVDANGRSAWAVRLRAAEMALKLMGAFQKPGKDVDERAEKAAKSAHTRASFDLSKVPLEVLKWVTSWYRATGSRPPAAAFRDQFGRDPVSQEWVLLCDSMVQPSIEST